MKAISDDLFANERLLLVIHYYAMIALGVDPGTATTGYGIVKDSPDGRLFAVDYGVIRTESKTPFHIRLKEIHEKVDIPLVIHGSTGFPDEAVPQVISYGVAKFNVGTVLKKAFFNGLKEAVQSTPEMTNPQHIIGNRYERDILAHASNRMSQEVERLIALYMGKGSKPHTT